MCWLTICCHVHSIRPWECAIAIWFTKSLQSTEHCAIHFVDTRVCVSTWDIMQYPNILCHSICSRCTYCVGRHLQPTRIKKRKEISEQIKSTLMSLQIYYNVSPFYQWSSACTSKSIRSILTCHVFKRACVRSPTISLFLCLLAWLCCSREYNWFNAVVCNYYSILLMRHD